LAARLQHLRGPDLVVLGLPRGGVVVAAQVARALHATLDVLVVRKLGHPGQPELAIGAIGEGGVRVLTPDPSVREGVDDSALQAVEQREAKVLRERVARLRQDHPRVDLDGRVALIVDDGIATGSTIRAACLVARGLGAARVVVGVPVAPADAVRGLTEADEVVCLATPARFLAVGVHYGNFSQTSEEEVLALLR
jgi:putative phosphoribosyl transferase